MKLYKTNSGLKYLDYAYFIEGINNTYLCVGSDNSEMYQVGEIYGFEDYEIEIDYKSKIQDFAISKTYLFVFWLSIAQLHQFKA